MGCGNQLTTGGPHNVSWEIGRLQPQKLWTALDIEVSRGIFSLISHNKLSFGDDLCHPYMVILGIIYCWVYHGVPHCCNHIEDLHFRGMPGILTNSKRDFDREGWSHLTLVRISGGRKSKRGLPLLNDALTWGLPRVSSISSSDVSMIFVHPDMKVVLKSFIFSGIIHIYQL